MACVEVVKWPKGLAAQRPKVLLNSSRSSGGGSSIVLRTSGVTTRRLSRCTRAYIGLLGREVSGMADLHVITDLSLTAPDGLPPHRLRALADEHEAQLEQALPGVEAFAFTVADLLRAWPGVAWPVPGDPGFRDKSAYDRPTQVRVRIRVPYPNPNPSPNPNPNPGPNPKQGWLDYVHRAVRKHGDLSRSLHPNPDPDPHPDAHPHPHPHPNPNPNQATSRAPYREARKGACPPW